MKLYLVGGAVRDRLLGMKPGKDLDFAVEADSFDDMLSGLHALGLVIWQSRPEFVTVRGCIPRASLAGFEAWLPEKGPRMLKLAGDQPGVHADFTLCRAEAQYSDQRHPDKVTPATIRTDLQRRDFTINAIAVRQDGTVIDPTYGRHDAEYRRLMTVGSAAERFTEDPLRILRGVRFAVTRKLYIPPQLIEIMDRYADQLHTLPKERVVNELLLAFRHDTWNTLRVLAEIPRLEDVLAGRFSDIWLKPTTEER